MKNSTKLTLGIAIAGIFAALTGCQTISSSNVMNLVPNDLAGLAELAGMKADCEGLVVDAPESARSSYNIVRNHVDLWISRKQIEIEHAGGSLIGGAVKLSEASLPPRLKAAEANFLRAATGGRESYLDEIDGKVPQEVSEVLRFFDSYFRNKRSGQVERLKSELEMLRWQDWDSLRAGGDVAGEFDGDVVG